MSLLAEQNALQFAVPGGLIGVGTKIDPKLTRARFGRWGFGLRISTKANSPGLLAQTTATASQSYLTESQASLTFGMLQPSQVQTSLWGMCSDIQANFQAAGLQTIDDKTDANTRSKFQQS